MPEATPSSQPSPNPDLELASTDDLIAELARRHDLALFVGWQDRDARSDVTHFRWSGGVGPCLGLVAYAQVRLAEELKKAVRLSEQEQDES